MKIYHVLGFAAMFVATPSEAQSCLGYCGAASSNGVVTVPPAGDEQYSFISTFGSEFGAGQIDDVGAGGDFATGSEFTTSLFTANTGDKLNFFFNYVTSDAFGDFTDYSFAELLSGGEHAAWLFTARTLPEGSVSPGFDLPSNEATLSPSYNNIIPGGPEWDQIGGWSQACAGEGCGYTDWIGAEYDFVSAGHYSIRFGITNYGDAQYDSGLAFTDFGLTSGDVNAVPEPSSWAMMLIGFGVVGCITRSRGRRRLAFASVR